jgi:hypothetical protein
MVEGKKVGIDRREISLITRISEKEIYKGVSVSVLLSIPRVLGANTDDMVSTKLE